MSNKENDNNEIDLQELFFVLLSKAWIIFLATALCGLAAFFFSEFLITPQYQSTTTVYMLNKQNESGSVTYSDVQLSSTLSSDYEELVTSRSVLERAISELDLDMSYSELAKKIETENPSDTRMIAISVTDDDPAEAQRIANKVREVAAERIVEVMDLEAVNVVDEANYPTLPVSPSISKNTIIGALVGFLLACAVIIVLHLLDDTIKTSEDIEKYLGVTTLALIPVNTEYETTESESAKRDNGSSDETGDIKKDIKNSTGKSVKKRRA